MRIGAAMALASLASAAQAQGQSSCLSKAEAKALFAYVLPEVATAIRNKCSTALPANAFLSSGSSEMVGRFRANAEGRWPLAKAAMMKMMAEEEPNGAKLVNAMPDEGVRALFNAAFTIGMTDMIKEKDCGKVDQFVQTLAPLPAPNMVELLILFFEMGSEGDKKAPFAICKA
ncbi:MAG: hypothetical protein M3Q19_06635 [Pseudomonadota bacterium]|nr:hypothetical protein [Pseudomonadota bacterium]